MNRIFLIDDGPATGESVRRMLRSAGTMVVTFQQPAKGLAEALANPPDLGVASDSLVVSCSQER